MKILIIALLPDGNTVKTVALCAKEVRVRVQLLRKYGYPFYCHICSSYDDIEDKLLDDTFTYEYVRNSRLYDWGIPGYDK